MMLGTTIVPLVLQNTTQLLPTTAVDSVCQSSTIVLSVSSTTITAGDDTISTSYSIFPVDHYTSQAPGLSTAIVQSSTETADSLNDPHSPDVATNTLSFSGSSVTQSRDQLPSESSSYVVFPPTLSSTSHIIGMSLSTTSLSELLYSLGPTLSSQAGPNAPTGTPSGLTFVSQSSMSTVTEQTITTIASSTSIATATANPVYTCPRDNGMYYLDTTNQVYQLLCNTDELDATIGTTYQSQLQSCVDACSGVEGCIGVSYTATSGSCSYKSSVLGLVSSETSDSAIATDYICPGADGTRLVDTSGSVYEILCNTVFPTSSNITSSLAVNDLASCSEICSGIDGCSGFTYQNGSCTTVSSRNSNDGITRMNVETAILLAKRVAQVVSSGIAPYRSTTFVQSLPADISRTPSSTLQDMSATFTASSGTVKEPGGTVAVTSTIIASSPANSASSTSVVATSSSADASPSSSDAASPFTLSSSAAQDQAASSAILANPATASALTISATSAVSTTTLTRSGTPGPSIGTSNGISIVSSAPSSIRSLASNDVPTNIVQSSQGPTVVLSSLLLSATQNFPSSTVSSAEAPMNTAILPSGSPDVTRSGESVIFRPTLATSQTSSVFVGASSSVESSPNTLPSVVVSSSNIVRFSTVSAVSYSTVSAASYFAAPSSLPPETNYSCPSANGEQVQANTGGSYTIGCDEETTGYDALVATAPDFNDCMTYCDQLPSCTAWTYSGSCYLKTGASASAFSFQPSSRGAVSGIRAVPAGNSGLPGSSPTDFATASSALQTTGSAESTDGELGALSTASATPPPSLPSFVEESTTIVLTEASVQTSEDLPQSTSYQSVTTQLLSSVVDTSSNLATEITAMATTSELGATSEATAGDIETTVVDGGSAANLSYPTSTISTSSVTDIISPPTTDSTPSLTTNALPASITTASPSITCSVHDNLLDICLDAVITPSVGVGGAASLALGSITIVDASTSLGIALSAAASADIGISVGTGGVETGASASIGISPAIGGTQQPAITTSTPSSSCSAGGNALDICIDAAITPSVGIGGNAGIAVGSSTITLVDVSASLAIAPTLAAGVDIGVSTDTSDIALVASASLEANLGLGSNTIGTLPNNTAPTSTANCSAGGNILNVCVDATITASANAGLDLNLGPSSSALTLLDASVALAPSVGAGLDIGLSVGSSGINLGVSATLGVNLGLSAGLNLGSGQSTASPALAASSTITTTNINLLPTSSLALATGLSLSLGQSTASSALATGLNLGSGLPTANQALTASSTVTTTIINLLPTSSLALAAGLGTGQGQSSLSISSISSTSSRLSSVLTTTTSKATSTSIRASSTPNLVQSLTGALGRQVTYPTDPLNGRQGFTTLAR